jgi:hypothetical protein
MAQIGEKVDSPMTLLREYLTCLTALLRGESVTFHGRYVNLDNVALDWPPDPAIELLAAATGPRTLQLNGDLITGTVITGGTTPDALRAAVEHVRAGLARRAESRPRSVVTYVLCTTGPTAHQGVLNEIRHCGSIPPATSPPTAPPTKSPPPQNDGRTRSRTPSFFSQQPAPTSKHSQGSSVLRYSPSYSDLRSVRCVHTQPPLHSAGANHAHSVWRDPAADFGPNVFARHRAAHH